MTEERVEALARMMYAACPTVAYVGYVPTAEEAWETVDEDERDLCLAHARAACEFICGKDEKGNAIIPEEGAVGKAREVLELGADTSRISGVHSRSMYRASAIDEALKHLGGGTE